MTCRLTSELKLSLGALETKTANNDLRFISSIAFLLETVN